MSYRIFGAGVLLAGLALMVPNAVANDYPITLKEVAVPRDEMRQQILLGIKEHRYDFSLLNVPYGTTFFAECYTNGKMTHRYALTTALSFQNSEYGHGTISLGWDYNTNEIVMIVDNGFGLSNSRLVMPPEDFDRPSVVVAAETPIAETRLTPDSYPPNTVIYPILGLVGTEPIEKDTSIVKNGKIVGYTFRGKTHFSLTSAPDFIRQATKYGTKHCMIIYVFSSLAGGDAPFAFKNGEHHSSAVPTD